MSTIWIRLYELSNQVFTSLDTTVVLIAMCAFQQGIQELSFLATQYLFKDDFQVSPALMGVAVSFIYLPWYRFHIEQRYLKPLWGGIADSYTILGKRRKSYIVFFSFLNFVLWQVMAHYAMKEIVKALICLMMISLCVCFTNVVGEALIVEMAAKHKTETSDEFQKYSARYVSIFFGMRALGSIISSFLGGYLLNFITKSQIYQLNSVFPLLLFLYAVLFYTEMTVDPSQFNSTLFNTFGDFWKFFQNPLIYKPVIFLFCFNMVPQSSAIMFYFYTNVLGFSVSFMGFLRFVVSTKIYFKYAITTLVGIVVYNQYLRNVPFKKIFLTSTITLFLFYESTIALVTRKNVEWGINDKFFCFGDTVLIELISQFNSMPVLVLATRMCPKNIEATMYALITSTLNFGIYCINKLGMMIGIQLGSLLLILMGINQENYSRLWLFILITGILILVPLPWLYVIKEKKMLQYRERKALDDEKGLKYGSNLENQDLKQD